jgi:hypothetical protein
MKSDYIMDLINDKGYAIATAEVNKSLMDTYKEIIRRRITKED